ncbi:ABC transporter ATP-binding protein [Facklamia languida]|uniref:ABC transporter domain-containing protein n=1 Tax=Facklamia languida CCUG 37842 TaxID=883113 RepID=H3NJG5_9LACT|nr:ATP-binding cassette domain-containing protein [Facklamia languida]EHR36778.1 hypothetical protein HMPREF9708_01004 [Facklamia languida CCUG 37842]
MVLLEVNKVSKSFGSKQVLDQVDLVVNEGEVVGLVGHNGSGKTMLLRTIIASMRLNSGQVYLKDHPVVFNQPLPIDVGVIIENPDFIPHFTGLENLKYLASIKDNYQENQVLSLLKDLDLYQHKDIKVSNYSLGMRQKLAIVQALMEDQALILLDEPTNGLDKDSVKVFIGFVQKIKSLGKGFLIASHDDQLIQAVSDHIYEIADGRIVGGQR